MGSHADTHQRIARVARPQCIHVVHDGGDVEVDEAALRGHEFLAEAARR
ncbi:MAG: hypothetical protein R2851_26530 [Caldilineaceae bacterium]